MEWYQIGLSLMALLIFFIFVGLPIPFAMAAAALPFLLSIQGLSTSLVSAGLKLWGVWIDYILLSVPLFVFLGELIGRSNIGPNLYRFMHNGIPMRGSAAYGSIGACAGFGAVCGSSMVGSLTIGGVALPEMLKLGYDRKLSSGVLAAGGTLSVLIPPSLILLFYGIVTDQSIGKLFIAGIIPGLLLAALFVLVVAIWAKCYPADIPEVAHRVKWAVKDILFTIGPVFVIGAIITISIYAGIATPTEAAAIAALATLILAILLGGLSRKGFMDALMATMRTMGYLGLLLSAGVLFGFVTNYYQIPQQFSKYFLELGLSPYWVLLFVIVFYIVIGMFLEPVSMTFITLPTIYPLIASSGYDLIWFGVLYTITMEIAVLTPPVGLNLFVIQGISKDQITIGDVIKGSLPFIACMLVLLCLLIAFPQVAMWLPELMK